MLDKVGDDAMEHRAEDEVLDTLGAGGVDERDPDLAFAGMQGGPDVVGLLHAANCPLQHLRVADIPDNHVVDAGRAKAVGRCLGRHGGSHVEAGSDQLRDEQLALIPVCCGDQDHPTSVTCSPAIHTPRMLRVAAISMVGSSASSTRSARSPAATRPRSASPKCSAATEVAASNA